MNVTRRRILRGGAGLVGATVVGTSALVFTTDPTVAATGLTASDVSVSNPEGNLQTLTITPDITISWDGQESAVASIDATWYVKTNSTSETTVGSTPYSISVSDPSKSGSISHTFPEINLLSDNGGALSESNFDASTDGGSNTTDVSLSIDAKLKDSGSNIIAQESDILGPKTNTVTVTNATSTVSSSGTANTSGS